MTRVLILDDRPINRQVLTTLLTYKGFETREAADGVEGLEIARAWTPDLAIVDIVMPRMDGIEFVQQLRADPAFASVPVIFYTASYDTAVARRIAQQSSVAHLLMKPSEPEVILETISRALGRTVGPPVRSDFDRVQAAAMRTGALIDFQLEIAAQRSAAAILAILARTARNVITSRHSVVEVGSARFLGCDDLDCADHDGGTRLRLPIETAGQRYGWLTLIGDAYDADDERIAQTLVTQAALAYENLKLLEEVRLEAELLDRNVNLLHATIEASGDGILVVDREGRYVTFNQKFVEITRLPEDDTVGHVIDNAPEDLEARVLETPDGRFLEYSGAPRRLNGEVIGRVWNFRDVTPRVRAQEALRQSEEKYRTLVDHVPDVVWTGDSAGRMLFISPNIEAMTGFTAEEINWTSRIAPEDLEHTLASYAAFFEGRQAFDSEFRFRRKNGSWIWIHGWSLGTYERDGVRCADGVMRDITARKQSEEELRRVARERALLLQSTGDGIFAVDADGVCTMANRVAATLLGHPIDELVGVCINDLIHPHGAPFSTEKPVRVADTFVRSDGSSLPVEYVASPIVDEGIVRGTVVSFADMTERRRLEQRLEQVSRIDSLGRMAATIAHEFNNVLMGIQPFAEIIRRKAGADEGLQKAASHIMNSLARGKSITQDILRMAKATEPQPQSVELIPWLEALATEIRALAGTRVRVELDVPAWDPLFVRCDPSQMQQVLTNLAVNARDAMGGMGTLRIAAERAAGDHVRMIVGDTGCGIDAQTLPYIFEPLFTTKHSGTGLGLAVAQQIVVRNGGTIAVESTPGEGTRFTIELPAAPPPARETAAAAESDLQQLGIERVLIVEDDPSVGPGLAAILEGEGVDVRLVDRGYDAAKALAAFDPDVVLIDVSLPDMSGAEVYEQIVARRPSIGVIFSTGHADEARLPHPRAERVGFLRKPYGRETLLGKLREVVTSCLTAGSRTTP
jgi:PAS domain S-box-containing protein